MRVEPSRAAAPVRGGRTDHLLLQREAVPANEGHRHGHEGGVRGAQGLGHDLRRDEGHVMSGAWSGKRCRRRSESRGVARGRRRRPLAAAGAPECWAARPAAAATALGRSRGPGSGTPSRRSAAGACKERGNGGKLGRALRSCTAVRLLTTGSHQGAAFHSTAASMSMEERCCCSRGGVAVLRTHQ